MLQAPSLLLLLRPALVRVLLRLFRQQVAAVHQAAVVGQVVAGAEEVAAHHDLFAILMT